VIRWFNVHLQKFLMSGRLARWTPAVDTSGQFQPRRVWYTNTNQTALESIRWLGRAAEYEAGSFNAGGRLDQSAKAARCAAIVAHEVSVLMAKDRMESEKKTKRSNQNHGHGTP